MLKKRRQRKMINLDIPLDGWLCIWRFGYECNAKMIENRQEAWDYFKEDVGFSKEDIAEIMLLEEGNYWDGDPNGLVIYKLNKRIEDGEHSTK